MLATGSSARVPGVRIGTALTAAGALLSFAFAVVNPYYLNIYWQIPDGIEILHGHFPSFVSYAITSGPVVSQEWLFEAVLAWAASHQMFGPFAIACGLAAAATPPLTYLAVRSFGIGDAAAGIAAFLVVGARFAGSGVRPETFAIDAFAVEMLVLARNRDPLLVLPATLIWANVHASVVIAPVVALVYAAAQFSVERRVGAATRHALKVTALTAFATFVTPHGVRLWSYALALTIGSNPARQHLDVWKPLAFDSPGSILAVLPGLLILICLGAVVKRRHTGELMVAALYFALSLLHTRYSLFLVVAWAPVLARTLEERTGIIQKSSRHPTVSTLFLAPCFIYAFFYGAAVARLPIDSEGPWRAAAAIVSEHRLHGNTYAPYVWSAYLHWRRLPLRLLIDAHGDPYPSDVWDDHLALEKVRRDWRDVLQRRHIELVVVPSDSALAQALMLDPLWHSIETRGGIVAFERVAKLFRSNSGLRIHSSAELGDKLDLQPLSNARAIVTQYVKKQSSRSANARLPQL